MIMFKSLYDAISKNSLLDDSFKLIGKLCERTEEMFEIASESFIENEEPEEDLFKMDKEVNSMVQDIRRKVLEYFSMTTAPNYFAGLVLISLAVDYERIGDYTKKLYSLREIFDYHDGINGELAHILRDMRHNIMIMFPEAFRFIEERNEKYPNNVTEHEKKVKRDYERLLERIHDDEVSKEEALAVSKFAGRLVRIAGHLDNISSSSGRPFPKLGFKPGSASWTDD